jgi:hypothetical protein
MGSYLSTLLSCFRPSRAIAIPDATGDEASDVFRKLRGQHLFIPDLSPIYDQWMSGQNANYEQLRRFFDERIDVYVKNEKARAKNKAINLAYFLSM